MQVIFNAKDPEPQYDVIALFQALSAKVSFYHVCDVKGRHDLSIQRWTKLGTHAQSNKCLQDYHCLLFG